MMKCVIQIVDQASLSIKGTSITSIKHGMVIFVGFGQGDEEKTIVKMVDKIVSLRIFPDEHQKTNLSILDTNGEMLCIPNFTLYADTSKSRRPSFTAAAIPALANDLFIQLKKQLLLRYAKVQFGVFGADMSIIVHNQGPFTLILDSNETN
jgi:D-tyrosyl-tRNA(Tyr) deacylase